MMKNLTISADPAIIARARAKAAAEHTTLNEAVRRFLAEYAQEGRAGAYDALMAELDGCRSGGPFTRDEANQR